MPEAEPPKTGETTVSDIDKGRINPPIDTGHIVTEVDTNRNQGIPEKVVETKGE